MMTTDDSIVNPMLPGQLHGRREILTNETVITDGNVLDVLNEALKVHNENRREIVYLYKYRRGLQPILSRVKKVNPEITNRIVVNLANEIVAFKVASYVGEPIQYVSIGSDPDTPGEIEKLNAMMRSERKATRDVQLADWVFTCGVGYRLTLNDKQMRYATAARAGEKFDKAPFEVYTLDSRNSFVVKANDVAKTPVMGVNYVFLDPMQSKVRYTVYTRDVTYTFEGTAQRADTVIGPSIVHRNGYIPITEYVCNTLRMGAFEPVLDLMDAYNLTISNKLDGVEQFIQALMIFKGVDITREKFLELKDLGAILLPPAMDGHSQPDVTYLNEQLDQAQTQTLLDAMEQKIYEIVGMPSQGSGNTSDSSNNGAAYIKNGGWAAETRIKETTGLWNESELDFLENVLTISRDADALNLSTSDIEVKIKPNNYEDKLVKVQSFTTLISAGAPPIQAFKYSELDPDPESAAMVYDAYQEQRASELDELSGVHGHETVEEIETVTA